jgi:hypothetical protein
MGEGEEEKGVFILGIAASPIVIKCVGRDVCMCVAGEGTFIVANTAWPGRLQVTTEKGSGFGGLSLRWRIVGRRPL